MTQYTIEGHPIWNVQICCMFAGLIMGMPKDAITEEPLKLAGRNFRAIYKTLSFQERVLVRQEIRAVKEDPQGCLQSFTDHMQETFEDTDLLGRLKDSDL